MIKEESTFNYDTFFNGDINKVKEARYSRFEQITKIEPTKNGVRAYIEHKECPECGYPVKYSDIHRKESVCDYCGVVLDKHPSIADPKYIINRSKEDLPENDGILRKDEKKVIAKIQGRPYDTPMREYRLNKQYLFINTAGNELNMLKPEIRKVKKIIYNNDIKKIHRGLDYEIVITGICLYILRSKGYLIPYRHKFVRKIGLNKIQYNVIKRKLDKLNVLENS